ncbi:uncharacterized protein sb:cb1058 [Clupea harengus]|uniref:Uncharacterized protein sb:cb1058 n=1 Tax=Clupea harengus TaxID=7950 RepID=A0A6P3VQL1_CLUHA|nr:uncharacterized protein sb:cb1058 [Clupea harengus]
MTGNRSKKTKISSSPSFLDKAGGFYGRLDETEVDGGKSETTKQGMSPGPTKREPDVFHFNEGMMEDDGTTTLLRRKPSRWSRRSSRKVKADKGSPGKNIQSVGTDSDTTPGCGTSSETQTVGLPVVQEPEPTLIHFSIREEADDHSLIQGHNCEVEVKERKKGKEENREEKNGGEQMKMAKRSTLKLYRKAIDRAFRRGWETFVTSLYSVSLTPVTSTPPSSSSSGKAKKSNGSVLMDYR